MAVAIHMDIEGGDLLQFFQPDVGGDLKRHLQRIGQIVRRTDVHMDNPRFKAADALPDRLADFPLISAPPWVASLKSITPSSGALRQFPGRVLSTLSS